MGNHLYTDALNARELGREPPYHVYLGGPYPEAAFCGWRLYVPPEEEGEYVPGGWAPIPDTDGKAMAATSMKAYESLGHFMAAEWKGICDDCLLALATRLGYDSVGSMWEAHRPDNPEDVEPPEPRPHPEVDEDEPRSLSDPLTPKEEHEMAQWIEDMGERP